MIGEKAVRLLSRVFQSSGPVGQRALLGAVWL